MKKHKGFSLRYAIICFLGLSLVFIATEVTLAKIKQNIESSVQNSLTTVVNTTSDAINIWANSYLEELTYITQNNYLRRLITNLLALENDDLASAEAQTLFRTHISQNNRHLSMGYFVISPDYTNIAALNPKEIGSNNNIAIKRGDMLAKVFDGQSIFVPPIEIKAHPDMHAAAYFVAPITNQSGQVVAALALQIDPKDEMSQLAQAGRIGDSGETYAYDNQGKLITESRFNEQLVGLGLLGLKSSSILNIELRNRKTKTLTKLGGQAENKLKGYDIKGYQDYRGVLVVGSWLWNDALDIGITTEIDHAEAYSNYRYVERIVYILLAALLALFVFTLYFSYRNNKRYTHTLEQSKLDLEQTVKQRTKQLAVNENNFRGLFESSRDAIVILNNNQFVDCNHAAKKLFQIPSDAIIQEIKLTDLSVEQQDASITSVQKFEQYLQQLKTQESLVFEWQQQDIHGFQFPTEICLTKVDWQEKELIQASIRNIARRKRAELDALMNQHKVEKILEATPEPILVVDSNGIIIQTNAATTRVFEYSESELIDRSVNMLIPMKVAKNHDSLIRTYIKSPKRMDMGESARIFASTKSGRQITVEITLNPI